MRNVFLIFFISVCQAYALDAYSQNRKLNLNMNQVPLASVLERIEDNSEYFFLYNAKLVDVKREVSITAENQEISEILSTLFLGTGVKYKIIDRRIILSPGETSPSSESTQQQSEITGKVTDTSGTPLPGVSILVKNTSTGSVSDGNGNFQLNIPSNANVIIFSFMGMKTQEVALEGRVQLNVVLMEETIGVDEVVVIGYGTQSRENITTSVTKMDSKVLDNIPYSNVASALQGSVSGVLVQSTNGQPGAAPRIIIRGGTSINNPNGASPLYVVDGVIRTNINNLNSEDIESIQVLKDAASTAVYGARGSNGIVLITTKSGKSGQVQFSYNADLTFSQVGKTYDMASARDYIYYGRLGVLAASRKNPNALLSLTQPNGWGTGNDLTKNTGYTTQYLTPENEYKLNEGWESMPDPVDPSKTIIFKGTDWQEKLFRTGISKNHHISVMGGTEKSTFNLGVGYLKNEGVARTTGYERLTFNMNGELRVKENLNLFGRVMYSNSNMRQVYNYTNVFFRAAGLTPTAKYTFEDGSLAPGAGYNMGNPVYFLGMNKEKYTTETLTLSVGGHWDILPGLSFDPQLSLDKATSDNYNFIPSYLNGANNLNTTRSASSGYSKALQTQADAVFSYSKTFFDTHNIDAMAGFSYADLGTFNVSASGQGAATDLIPTLNASSTMVAMSSSISENILFGYFGRLNYNFDQKYLISLNVRYDGASQLGKSNKWGFFPGASLGWNVHKENFWRAFAKDLVRLKLRGSYGITGNISGLGDFQSQGSYAVGSKYMGVSAIQNTVIPNPDLKWEQSKTLNFGTDISVFEDRVNLIVDCYHRITTDLLTTLTLPPSTGFSSIFTNLGSLENRGLEVEIGARLLPAKSPVQWKVALNASKTKHKILKLPHNGTKNNRVGGNYVWDLSVGKYNWLGGLQEGGRIGDYYAWKQTGIYATDEEALSAPVDLTMSSSNKTKYGGDVNYLDSDRNDTIDVRDIVYMGNPFPKWTGGISSSLSYKGLDLYVRLDYMTGHTIYNHAKIFMAGQWAGNLNFPQELVTKGWKKQGDIATRPQYIGEVGNYSYWRGSAYHTTTTNSEFYESGDFLCIREVTLSYRFSGGILKKVGIDNLRFNLTGNNLHYFTKYTGMNPEEGGTDTGRYPLPKNIMLGVNVSF